MCEPNATGGWVALGACQLCVCVGGGNRGCRTERSGSVAEHPGLLPPSVPVTQTQVAYMPQ